MKVEEFIEEFNKSQNKEACVKKHIITDYINFERKVAICNLISKKLIVENGDLIKNTPMVYENFILSLVKEYTDIELTAENNIADFNLIEKNEVSDILAKVIGRDAKAFNTILDMTINDTIDNHNNLINHLTLKSENLNYIFDKLQSAIQKFPQTE